MDRGDGKEILDDNSSTDDVTHTGNSQPHNRTSNFSEPLNSESKRNSSKAIRQKKLSNIHAFSGQPPLDSNFYIELLSRVKVPLSVLEISENSRKKKPANIDGNTVENRDELLDELYLYLKEQSESNKAMMKQNSYELKPIKLGPHVTLTMGTTNGDSTPLHQFAEIKICVADIWRTDQVFVRPPTDNDHSTLILGLPWLYDVDADINIRKFQIRIRDKSKGEMHKTIKMSQFKPATHHKLSLIPLTSKHHDLLQSLPIKKRLPLESSSESESEREESESTWEENPSGKFNVTNTTLKRHL
ncbi:hypothetical protein EPUL_000585 [Erysiphe pulchra]|uniref:Uncharacterized protein n=1 Tax=Erysiphe pulchra TaxID=225359 RepID=A0A2S4PYB8_9PEZI|nr:hypothetical protein EPUL_000585 [Erysiphe pulchra]